MKSPVKSSGVHAHTALTVPLTLVVFSLVGVLIGLRTGAGATLPHILSPNPGMDFQNMVDGVPTPRLLDWDQTQIDLLIELRNLSGIGLVLAGTTLYAALGAVALRTLNPGFRLFRVVGTTLSPRMDAPTTADAPQSIPASVSAANDALPGAVATKALNTVIKPDGLIKASLIALLIGIPLLCLWLLSARGGAAPLPPDLMQGDVGRWNGIWALRLALLGASFWIGFHPEGLAGSSASRALHIAPRAWPRIAAVGALFGLCAFAIGREAVPGALEPALLRFQALGAFTLTTWRQVMACYVGCMAAAWFAAAVLFALLARPAIRPLSRAALVGALCMALVMARWLQLPLQKEVQASRLDLTAPVLQTVPVPYQPARRGSGVPDGPLAAAELARRLGLPEPVWRPDHDRTVLLFNDDSDPGAGRVGTRSRIVNVVQSGATTDGLKPDTDSARRAADFLRRRSYRTGLSWVATKHRFDVATYHFDTTAALATCLDDLREGPHPTAFSPYLRFFHTPSLQVSSTVRAIFFICAATPANLAQLDRWADPDRFAYSDRQSLRLMGDLYRRYGDVKHALMWYRKADMPRSFMARIRSEQPLFHTGHVTGVLRLNGHPLAGVQVAVVPDRLNGLPTDLEGYVHTAIFDIGSDHPQGPVYGPYHPAPGAFRWISASAVTDTNGSFSLDGLTEGEYHLICTLPADVRLTPPYDNRLRVVNAPLPFDVRYTYPRVDLGIVDMFLDG